MKTQREKSRKSKSKARTTKSIVAKLALLIAYFFDVVWAVGASIAATMASPLLTH